MLLAVDVGNTEIVLGVFRGQELAEHWRVSSRADRTADELAHLFGGLLEHADLSFSREVTGVVISSVVPSSTQALREMTERYFGFEPVVVEPGTRTGMAILIDNPREVGADRIVNSLAAFSRYGGPCIVVDFGTATNFDVVSAKGEYVGGAIAPGIDISLEALGRRGAQLRKVELLRPRTVIAKNTVEALQSGVLYGFASQVDGIVGRMLAELRLEPGQANVIATGGLAHVVVEECASFTAHEPWLTLLGLEIVFHRNT